MRDMDPRLREHEGRERVVLADRGVEPAFALFPEPDRRVVARAEIEIGEVRAKVLVDDEHGLVQLRVLVETPKALQDAAVAAPPQDPSHPVGEIDTPEDARELLAAQAEELDIGSG